MCICVYIEYIYILYMYYMYNIYYAINKRAYKYIRDDKMHTGN